MAASLPSRDTTVERQAEGWMNDPYEYFGYHNTRIHSLPPEEVEAVQRAAMNLRLHERRPQIKMLEKLADGQGIRQINSLDEMAPLLMPHDVYKSYPVSLLAKQQFGKLNTWLSRLTRYDPTVVDVSAAIRSTAGSPSFATKRRSTWRHPRAAPALAHSSPNRSETTGFR